MVIAFYYHPTRQPQSRSGMAPAPRRQTLVCDDVPNNR